MITYGHVWRKISTYRGYGRGFRPVPAVGETWHIIAKIKLMAPQDEADPTSPMMSVGSVDCGRVKARVSEVGAHWADADAGREGWHIRFVYLEPAVDDDGLPVPADIVC